MRDIIVNLQESNTGKIQLTIAINFISSKDIEEGHVMYPKSNNIKITSYNNPNEVVDDFFESFRSRCQGRLETSVNGKKFILYSVELMYCKRHVVNF